jgi:lipid II:glycine glycyltransferase (peptidoglycan interpeptide bridge formation enzyme)
MEKDEVIRFYGKEAVNHYLNEYKNYLASTERLNKQNRPAHLTNNSNTNERLFSL